MYEHEESLPDIDILDRGYDNFSLLRLRLSQLNGCICIDMDTEEHYEIENENKITQIWSTMKKNHIYLPQAHLPLPLKQKHDGRLWIGDDDFNKVTNKIRNKLVKIITKQ